MSYISSLTKITFAVSLFMFSMCCISFTHADAQKNTHTKQQPKPHFDLGVDTATVKTQTALFTDPNINSAKIGVLRSGDLTVLVSRDIWNGWLRVIQYRSGRQGWVLVNRMLTPEYTKHKKQNTVLTGAASGTDDPPTIEVDNQSDVQLYLHVDKLAEMSVDPHSTKSFSIPARVFSFNAAFPNLVPDFGYAAFLTGVKYSWHFSVVSPHPHTERYKVTSETITEYQTLLADIKTKREEASIEKKQVDDARTSFNNQSDKVKTELNDIETKRATLDHSDEKAVNDFNSLVDNANSDLETYKGMKQPFNAKVDAYNALIDSLNAEQTQIDDLAEKINAPH